MCCECVSRGGSDESSVLADGTLARRGVVGKATLYGQWKISAVRFDTLATMMRHVVFRRRVDTYK